MRNTIGERSLGIWLEFLSIGDRNGGVLPLMTDTFATALAFKCHSTASRVRQVWGFACKKNWIKWDQGLGEGLQSDHSRTAVGVGEGLQSDCSRTAVGVGEGLQSDRVARLAKYANYHKVRGTNKIPRGGALGSLPSEPSEPLKNPKKDSLVPPPTEALEMAQLLSDLIFENYPNRTSPTEAQLVSWARDAEKVNRIDGHEWDQIRELIEWCQGDSFWKANILSMSKFRQKWNQLLAKKESDNGRRSSPEPKGFAGIREILKNRA